MADWWQGGGESAPSPADLRNAGWFFRTDTESWEPPAGWIPDRNATMQYSPPGLLDQPKQVSVDYILKNHPTLSGLPKNVLDAMAQNWQLAYSQLAQYSPEQLRTEKLPTGYIPARIRNQEGQLVLSYGGPEEMYAEARPYISYSPQYGLIVPQQAIRPPEWGRGLGRFIPAIIGGAIMGPLAAALGGGALGAASAGALTGGATSAVTGGNALEGALTGGITAGLGQAASPAIDSALKAADISGSAAAAIKAGTIAAGKAGLTGGDPLQAALTAAAGAGVGTTVGGMDALKELDPTVAKAVTSAASGAARAAVSGGDPVQSAIMGGINATLGGLTVGTVAGPAPVQYAQATPSGTMIDAPVIDVPEPTVDELIDQMLAREEPITALPSYEYATPTEQYIDTGGLAVPAQSGLYDIAGNAITKDAYATFSGPMFDEQGQMVVAAGQGMAAPQGEIEVAGTAPTYQDLLDQLMQQDEDRAGMQTALLGYDQRLIDALKEQEAEKAAMQKALEDIGASQEAQRGQIGGIQTNIGQLTSNLLNRLNTIQKDSQQQISQIQKQSKQAQQQSDLSNLLLMLGMAQQQKKEQPPIPLVGEIKPFEFSTDLLEDIYAPRRQGLLGANDQLLTMTRGQR